MGYWSQDDEGHAFAESETDPGMTWGDQPADIVGNALDEIKAVFVKDMGRLPTRGEILAGLQFSTAALSGLPETVEQAEAEASKQAFTEEEQQVFSDAYWRATDHQTKEERQESSLAWGVLNSYIKRLEVDDPETRLTVVEGG